MANPTKVLKTTLSKKLQDLLDELIIIQGDAQTLSQKLLNIDTNIMSEEEATVINDLKAAFTDTNKHVSERLSELEASIISFNMNQMEMGTFNEAFTYDTDGNVTKHEMTGDNPSVTEYNYKTDGSGELVDSNKTFIDMAGNEVIITKDYTYTEGNITGIATITTITPPAEPEA